MSRRNGKIFRYVISAIIMFGVIYYFATSDFDFLKTWKIIKSANFIWVFLPIPIMLLSHWIRAMRWQTMLKPIMSAKSVFNLFSAVMIGYAINNVIPRGGEFIRPYVYSKREKVSFSSVFATIIVERVLDLIVLFLLFLVAFFILQDRILKMLPSEVSTNSIILIVVLFIALFVFSFYPPFIRFFLRIIIKPVSEKLYNRISELIDKFTRGFAIIKKPGQYFRLTIESLAIWFCYSLPMYIMFYSFNFVNLYGLHLGDAMVLLIIGGIGITIAPSPGGIGIYHGLIVTALTTLYGVSPEESLAYATVTHGINFMVQVVVGFVFLLRENIKKLPDSKELAANISETGK